MPWSKRPPFQYVTATPLTATPLDGAEIYYAADPANGVVWHLRYNANSGSTYKWEYVGGPPLRSFVNTTDTTTSITYTDLATAGPSVTAPLAGEYLLTYGVYTYNNVNAQATYTAVAVGNTAANDNDRAGFYSGGAGVTTDSVAASVSRQLIKTATPTSTVISLKYRVSGGTGSFGYRHLTAIPTRVTF